MQQLLNDMQRYRREARRAEYIEVAFKMLFVIVLCLLAYSCALDERHAGTAHGGTTGTVAVREVQHGL